MELWRQHFGQRPRKDDSFYSVFVFIIFYCVVSFLSYVGDKREGKWRFDIEVSTGIRRIGRIARGGIVLMFFGMIF